MRRNIAMQWKQQYLDGTQYRDAVQYRDAMRLPAEAAGGSRGADGMTGGGGGVRVARGRAWRVPADRQELFHSAPELEAGPGPACIRFR